MYINPFLAGVLATVFGEITILFTIGVCAAIKSVKRRGVDSYGSKA